MKTKLLGFFLFFFLNQVFCAVALDGYDPVSYFQEDHPLKGSSIYAWEYDGKSWYFIDESNRATFQKHPQKYAPQYEGYCALMVAQGRLTAGDPHYWTVTNGKLYLLCGEEVLRKWKANLKANIRKADKNWKKLRS